jgi:hypothetical protein
MMAHFASHQQQCHCATVLHSYQNIISCEQMLAVDVGSVETRVDRCQYSRSAQGNTWTQGGLRTLRHYLRNSSHIKETAAAMRVRWGTHVALMGER